MIPSFMRKRKRPAVAASAPLASGGLVSSYSTGADTFDFTNLDYGSSSSDSSSSSDGGGGGGGE